MQLAHKETDQALVLCLSGEIIMDVVADLKAETERLAVASPQPDVVVDLSEVLFMDSSGVGFLIGLRRLCLEHGKTLRVTHPTPPIKKLLNMLRLTDYFAVPQTPSGLPSA